MSKHIYRLEYISRENTVFLRFNVNAEEASIIDALKETFHLLKEKFGSNLIIDLRGIIDVDLNTLDWAITKAIPSLEYRSCSYCILIERPDQTLSVWEEDIAKYTNLHVTNSFEDSINFIYKNCHFITRSTLYVLSDNMLGKLLSEIKELDLENSVRSEEGCEFLCLMTPINTVDNLVILQKWKNEKYYNMHNESEYGKLFQSLLQKYMVKSVSNVID